jgi:hypothetical protein
MLPTKKPTVTVGFRSLRLEQAKDRHLSRQWQTDNILGHVLKTQQSCKARNWSRRITAISSAAVL